MITLTRTGLLLTLSADTIPAQGSSDVPISFVNDPETYTGFTIQPLAGWYKNGCKQSAVCRYADGTITVPAAAFQQNGEIMLAVALIDQSDPNHIEVTQPASAYVIPAPNDPTELPDEDTWQTAVDEFVTQVMQPYQTNIQSAIDTANAASQAANEAASTANAASQAATNTSNAINEAIENGDFIPQISATATQGAEGTQPEVNVTGTKQEPVLNFTIPKGEDGTGQTTVKKDEVVLTELDLNTKRTATPTAVKVQLQDVEGNTFYVETSADNVYLKGTDGSEISQQNLNDKIGQLINLVAFYSANPATVLADLKKYIITIS